MNRTPPENPLRRVARHLAWGVLAAASTGCSVADNLSADEILTEVDGIVKIEGTAPELGIRYAERAQVSAWYMRSWMTQPLRLPLAWLFGRTGETTLENPVRHVRVLLGELPDEVGGDLLVGAKAVVRLGWIAQLEQNAHSRLVAIDGLAAVAQDLGVPLFQGDLHRFGAVADDATLAAARAGLAVGRPDVRASGDEGTLQPYRDALARLVALPVGDGIARLTLLEEVTGLFAAENVAAMRPAVAAALRAAIAHVVEGVLVEIVQGRAPEYVDLRLCAMEQIRRLGGPRAVPLLLAVMAATPAQRARRESWYDPDSLVQLRLIQYCGQLRGELATTVLLLPGRQSFEAVAPVDFLAITILNEDAYYSKLRVPAVVALTWSLQRPRVDLDPAWVRAWREQRR